MGTKREVRKMRQEDIVGEESVLFQITPRFTFGSLVAHLVIDVLLIVVIIGLVRIFADMYLYLWAKSATYTLTERNLVVDSGVLFKSRKSLQLGPFVQSVSYVEGPLDKIWGVGTIVITLIPPALQTHFSLDWVPEPGKHCAFIQAAVNQLTEG